MGGMALTVNGTKTSVLTVTAYFLIFGSLTSVNWLVALFKPFVNSVYDIYTLQIEFANTSLQTLVCRVDAVLGNRESYFNKFKSLVHGLWLAFVTRSTCKIW